MAYFVDDTIKDLKKHCVDTLYISFDIDAIDSSLAGRTGTPEKEGLKPSDACLAIEKFSQYFAICACDLVEVAPFTGGEELKESDQTLEISAGLAKTMICAMNKS